MRIRRPAPPPRGAAAANAPPGTSRNAPLAPSAPRHKADDVEEPVAIGAQHQVVGTGVAERSGDAGALRSRGVGVAAAQALVRRLDLQTRTGLGVDEVEHAYVGQLELAWIDHLDAEHLVAGRHRPQRAGPTVITQ